MTTKNEAYWRYNLPLQVSGDLILNYMPRKDRCADGSLEDCRGDQTREEFLENAALVLENLAQLMRKAKDDPEFLVYYPDEGMNEH